MSFIEGFAQGFEKSYTARKEREAQKEDMMFKYKMDELMKNKDLRTKKKTQESEWSNAAKDLSGQLQDPEAASMFYKELQNGVSYETLQKRIMENQYEKNKEFTKPTQTVKIPTGVAPTVTAPDATAEKVAEKGRTPLGDMINRGKLKKEQAMEGRVNDQIDAINPDLRTYQEAEDTTPEIDYVNSPYKLKNNEYKIGDYADSLNKLAIARDNKDPEAIRKAEREVEIQQFVITQKERAAAEARGDTKSTYFMLNDQGEITGMANAESRLNPETQKEELWNTSLGPDKAQPIQGATREVDENTLKRYWKIQDDFSDKSKDYKFASSGFVSAMDSSRKIKGLLAQYPEVAAGNVAGGASLLNRVRGEFQALYSTVLDMENSIKADVEAGNIEGLEKKVADYMAASDKIIQSSGFDGVDRLSFAKAQYDTLRVQASYQFAMASGLTGTLSNQDFKNSYEAIGGEKTAPEVLKSLSLTEQSVFSKLDSSRVQLSNNESIKTFERDYGVKTGLVPKRIGDVIEEMDLPPETKAAMKQNLAVIQGFGQANKDLAVQQDQPKEPDEFGMTPGQVYPGAGGKQYRYLGGGKNPKNFEEVK